MMVSHKVSLWYGMLLILFIHFFQVEGDLHSDCKGQFEPTVLVHGGAGIVADDSVPFKKLGVKLAARHGYETLIKSGSVLDAVERAINILEEDINFNSGNGSALTWDGNVEMDASIMDGTTLGGGCVSLVRDIINPISLARRIMETTRHCYIAGEGAMKIAIESGNFEILQKGSLVTESARKSLDDYKASVNKTRAKRESMIYGSPGTVGAVAIDCCGNVAAGTSTGGITGKLTGRIGDSSILGGGTYADNKTGAVSATGHGETIMRYNVVSRILALVEYANYTAQEAAQQVLNQMTQRFDETGGVIAIDHLGQLGIYFTTSRMSWAYQRGKQLHFGVDPGEDEVEIVGE